MTDLGCPSDTREQQRQQMNHIWFMLDYLSENDPKAYRRFIEKQHREGTEFYAPPQPQYCMRAEILGPKKGLLYINVCGWKRVPPPQDPGKPVPLLGGKLESHTAEEYCVLDVAFSPVVLQEAKQDMGKRNNIHLLVLIFTQQQHGLKLSQQYTVTDCSLKGCLEDMLRRLEFRKQPDTPAGRTFQVNADTQTPGCLLKQMALREQDSESTPKVMLTPEPAESKKKSLIQVISSSVTMRPQMPEYQLRVNTDPGSSHSVELTVELPKVRSVSECQLSISQDDVLLEVGDLYHLLVELPEIVNEESATATFDKKKHKLTLKVAVL